MGGERPVNEVLGLGLFRDRWVMMDFKNNRLQMLEYRPADIGNCSADPVEKTASGLRIIASINNTPFHVIIDTGASHSFLFSDHLPASTLFSGCPAIEPEASNLDCRVTKINFADKKIGFVML